jgi:PhnB protein
MSDALPLSYPALFPVLAVSDGDRAMAFYASVFGATVRFELRSKQGRFAHAELEIGGGLVMVRESTSSETPPKPAVRLSVYVDDVDTVYRHAIAEGATAVRAIEDQWYGDRTGEFRDPFGLHWSVSTQQEQITFGEMRRRFEAVSES